MLNINPLPAPYRKISLPMITGIILAASSVISAIALIGLSGWFLTATALTGLGILSLSSYNLFLPSAIIRFLALGKPPLKYYEKLFNHRLTFSMASMTRVWFFKGIFNQNRKSLIGFRDIEFSSKMTSDINHLEQVLTGLIIPWFSSFIAFICATLYFSFVWPVAAIMLVVLYLVCGVVLPLISIRSGMRSYKNNSKQKELSIKLSDYLYGYKELRSYNLEAKYLAESKTLIHELSLNNRADMLDGGFYTNIQAFFLEISLLFFLSMSYLWKVNLDGPLLVLSILVIITLFEVLLPLAELFFEQGKTVAIGLSLEGFVESSEIRKTNPGCLVKSGQNITVTNLKFGYGKRILFQNLNIVFESKTTTLILGSNGSGKSTLLDLIFGFHAPFSGQILFDGKGIYDKASASKDIGYLEQRPFLFNESIYENIKLAKPDASIFEIQKAAHLAGLTDYLNKSEEGVMTNVGEGGRNLSGGQQRMISLARIILKDSPLIFLDEPSEGMDISAQNNFCKLINSWHGKKTILLVSHNTTMDILVDKYYRL